MTAFRHDRTGTPAARWAGASLLDALPAAEPPGDVVVVAAHPDDETLGAGGLIAAAGRAGHRVEVAVLTAGEASHPASPTHTPERLAARRQAEVRRAVHLLHPHARLTMLALPDGGLAARESEIDTALERLLDAIPDAALAGAPTLVAPWRGDGHPDHEAAGRAAAALANRRGLALWEYPVWAWHWAAPGDGRLPWHRARRLALPGGALAAKRRATAAHLTQTRPLSDLPGDEVLLGPDVAAHFARHFEVFLVTEP